MAETAEAPAQTEKKVEGTGKIVSAGSPQKMQFNNPNLNTGNEGQEQATEQQSENKTGAPKETETAKPEETQAAAPEVKTTLTKEEIKALYEENFPAEVAQSPEAIVKQEADFEKRMLDLYLNNGGKIEDFATLKELAKADLTQLSHTQLQSELKAAGFNEEEIKAIQKERYYQLEQEELDGIEDEEEKKSILKKKEFVDKKLTAKAEQTKKQAADFFDTLKKAISEQDLQAQKDKEYSSNLDEHLKKMPRKQTFQLGKTEDGEEIAPIEIEIPESVFTKVGESLKSPASIKQNLQTADGSWNFERLTELELRNAILEHALADALLEGQDRQVKIFKSQFGNETANSIGVGASNSSKGQGIKGKIVSAGQPQRFKPSAAKNN